MDTNLFLLVVEMDEPLKKILDTDNGGFIYEEAG